jgi:hypothetical protein
MAGRRKEELGTGSFLQISDGRSDRSHHSGTRWSSRSGHQEVTYSQWKGPDSGRVLPSEPSFLGGTRILRAQCCGTEIASARGHFVPVYAWPISRGCHRSHLLLKLVRDRGRWMHWLYHAKERCGLRVFSSTQAASGIILAVGPGEMAGNLLLRSNVLGD